MTRVLKNFAVFEGIDGAGTTTQLKLCQERVMREYPALAARFLFTAEPAKTPVGAFIREVLSGGTRVEPGALAYLFAADRFEHVYGGGGIMEAHNAGGAVICDRYVFSSLAYQGMACGRELPRKLNGDFPLPQFLFYFDIAVEEALARIASRAASKEIFETRDALVKTAREYQDVVREYGEIAEQGQERGGCGQGAKRHSLFAEVRADQREEEPPRMAAKADEGGAEARSRRLRAGADFPPQTMKIIHIDASLDVQRVHEIIWSWLKKMPIFTV